MSAECIGNPPLGASPGDAVRTEGASEQVNGDERGRRGATAEVLKEKERKAHGRNGECRASIATTAIVQLAARRSHNPKAARSILTRRICPRRRRYASGIVLNRASSWSRSATTSYRTGAGYTCMHTHIYISVYIYTRAYVCIYIYICMWWVCLGRRRRFQAFPLSESHKSSQGLSEALGSSRRLSEGFRGLHKAYPRRPLSLP